VQRHTVREQWTETKISENLCMSGKVFDCLLLQRASSLHNKQTLLDRWQVTYQILVHTHTTPHLLLTTRITMSCNKSLYSLLHINISILILQTGIYFYWCKCMNFLNNLSPFSHTSDSRFFIIFCINTVDLMQATRSMHY